MIEFVNKEDGQEANILDLAKEIKQACMRPPSYADCRNCECFNTYERNCDIGDPTGWTIKEYEEKK